MTPKEKAIELVNKFIEFTRVFDDCSGWVDDIISAKQCTLIAVDEIMNALPPFTYGLEFVAKIDYWQEVKQEIENL